MIGQAGNLSTAAMMDGSSTDTYSGDASCRVGWKGSERGSVGDGERVGCEDLQCWMERGCYNVVWDGGYDGGRWWNAKSC